MLSRDSASLDAKLKRERERSRASELSRARGYDFFMDIRYTCNKPLPRDCLFWCLA